MTREHTRIRTPKESAAADPTGQVRNYAKFILFLLVFLFVWFGVLNEARAGGLTFVSDTISTSVPFANANHTIKFTVTNTISVSGKIIIRPQSGVFTIPAALDYTDIDFLDEGTDQTLASSPGSGAGSAIGVSVASGSSGSITFTLNDTDSIFSASTLTVKIGTNATFGVAGDEQIKNPSTVGSYKIYIETQDASSNPIDQGDAMVAIVFPVGITSGIEAPPPPPPPPPPSSGGGGGGGGIIAPSAPVQEEVSTTNTGIVTVTPTSGGITVMTIAEGISVQVAFPAHAVDVPTKVVITPIEKSDIFDISPHPAGLGIVGDMVYDFTATAEGQVVPTFNQPVKLTFTYSDTQASVFNENTLKIYYWDRTRNQWLALLDNAVDISTNIITATTIQFSLFAVMGSPIQPIPPVLPARRTGDFNGDDKVDAADFSIFLFNWEVPSNTETDMNSDGVVDAADFSIFLFYWTG